MKGELYKFDTYYVVTKGNEEGTILKYDTLFLKYRKNTDPYSTLGEYTMFLPPRITDKSFFGLPPMNTAFWFKTIDELSESMSKIEIKYNIELAQKFIREKQKEIIKIKENHEIE